MLGPLEGELVLDLFAGTGALGIEALSRGARRAVFVERDNAAAAVLAANLTALGIGAQAGELRRCDALGALRSARERGEAYDLIFIDPPYGQASLWGPRLSAMLPLLLAPGGASSSRATVVNRSRSTPRCAPNAVTATLR